MKRLTKKPRTILVTLLIMLCAIAVIFFLYEHHRTHVPKTAQELACNRAAAAPKPSAHDAALEGQSIDEAICQGTIQPVTPAQSQQ